jgi:hypothetical protein
MNAKTDTLSKVAIPVIPWEADDDLTIISGIQEKQRILEVYEEKFGLGYLDSIVTSEKGKLVSTTLVHAERLQDLLRPSWPNAGEIQDKMYSLVDTLMFHGVDQKWFSSYALVEGAEVMLTTTEIHAVSLGFCLSACTFYRQQETLSLAAFKQLMKNTSRTLRIGSRSLRGLVPADKAGYVRKFKNLCKEGLLGPGDYGIFEDWLDIDKLQERYIRIKDGLVLKGDVQEMNNEENFYNEGPYEELVSGFFLAYHQVVAYHCWLLFHPADLEHFCEFEVSFECR